MKYWGFKINNFLFNQLSSYQEFDKFINFILSIHCANITRLTLFFRYFFSLILVRISVSIGEYMYIIEIPLSLYFFLSLSLGVTTGHESMQVDCWTCSCGRTQICNTVACCPQCGLRSRPAKSAFATEVSKKSYHTIVSLN